MNSHQHEKHEHGDYGKGYRDPVCGMSTDREGEYIRHDHEGRSYYFCSEHCLARFKQDPQAFEEK
jgi:Cu+-exporting ATPase